MAELHPPCSPSNKITWKLKPDIPFFHILPRLPAKSLLRFMSVCKQWHSFLTTPMFAKMHLHHVTNDHHQNHHKLLVLHNARSSTPYSFQTIDCEAPEDGLTAIRSLPFEAGAENMTIITSLNGLICVGIKKCRFDDAFSDLIFWNPLMGDYKTLSKANADEECYETTGRAFGLYYSSSDDDYRLLRVTHCRDAYIYSLKSNSWRKIDSTQDFESIPYWPSECWKASVLLNEKLYFLKEVKKGTTSPRSYSIIRFDTKTEKFTEIPTPSFGNLSIVCSSFTVLSGCIHFCVAYDIWKASCRKSCHTIELWRMDGDGDWTKVESYYPKPWYPWFEEPLHRMRNGNWVMYNKDGRYVYKVDLEKHTKEILFSFPVHSMDIPPRGKYIETFVSPNQ